MDINEFEIGDFFFTGSGRWVCVDKGSLFVLAIKEDKLNTYVEGEESSDIVIFDRWDFGGCWKYNQ